ncbi:MAG: bile acid:sodium symporter family protein [Bacteroidales bacterium]
MDKRNERRSPEIHSGLLMISLLFFLFGFLPQATIAKTAFEKIKPGMHIKEISDIIGLPSKTEKVERYHFHEFGKVIVKNKKIHDIRISGKKKGEGPLLQSQEGNSESENKLRFLRIGTSYENITNVAGTPDTVTPGEDLVYKDGEYIIETQNDIVTEVIENRETGLARLDWVKLNFSPAGLLIMNITLAFIMFGVALEIKLDNFKKVFKEPKSILLGIFSQFLALPALTFLLIYFIKPTPSVALGMILVAACPGGNISNFMSSLAKGNTALSISLTAFATISAVFMTPVNFAFWGGLYSDTANMVIPIRIDFFEMLKTVLLLLGIPVVLGIWFSGRFPAITAKITSPLKKISMGIFLVFVIMALLGNIDFFKSYIHLIFFIVLGHNALALLTGFSIGTLGRTSRADRRSLTIETGIQNSGLGLVLIFNPRLFDGLGGMAFIAAWWGIWHIISGLIMAYSWSKKPLPKEDLETVDVKSEK